MLYRCSASRIAFGVRCALVGEIEVLDAGTSISPIGELALPIRDAALGHFASSAMVTKLSR